MGPAHKFIGKKWECLKLVYVAQGKVKLGYKIVFRQMYTLYYLLLNTVYIKNSPTCFEPCHSLSSRTQLFITLAIYVWYSLKYIRWVDNLSEHHFIQGIHKRMVRFQK
jgi:hypothetical protein